MGWPGASVCSNPERDSSHKVRAALFWGQSDPGGGRHVYRRDPHWREGSSRRGVPPPLRPALGPGTERKWPWLSTGRGGGAPPPPAHQRAWSAIVGANRPLAPACHRAPRSGPRPAAHSGAPHVPPCAPGASARRRQPPPQPVGGRSSEDMSEAG